MTQVAAEAEKGMETEVRRAKRLAALRQAVQAGSYFVPAAAVAERILDHALRPSEIKLCAPDKGAHTAK